MSGGVLGQELGHLGIAEIFEPGLGHGKVLGRQRRAVVQTATGEDHAVARVMLGEVPQELAPEANDGSRFAGDLVERVEQEGDPALPQELDE